MTIHRVVGKRGLMETFKEISKVGKIQNIEKSQKLVENYEKSCWRRVRIQEEKIYFKKWSYLKYASEVVQFSSNNHLLFGRPLNDNIRLTNILPQELCTLNDLDQKLKELSSSLNYLRDQILKIDSHQFTSNNSTHPDQHTIAPTPAFDNFLEMINTGNFQFKSETWAKLSKHFNEEELYLLNHTITTYSNLKEEFQALEQKKKFLKFRISSNKKLFPGEEEKLYLERLYNEFHGKIKN